MKRFKWTIMTLAIVFSICGAFATRPHYDCRTATQYMWNGTAYELAGTEGVNYQCTGISGTCTYTLSNQVYTPCQFGTYDPVPQVSKKAK
jgi:Family of unknown function (DUF6520)